MTIKTNLKDLARDLRKIIRVELKNAANRVPIKISANCANPALKGWFGSKYKETADGAGFEIYTTFPKPIAVYIEEFGRAGRKTEVVRAPGLGRGRPPHIVRGGIPIRLGAGKVPTKPIEEMGPKERAKWEGERIIIRSEIKPYKGHPFIRRTWKEEYFNLLDNIRNRIEESIRRNKV